MSSTLSLNSEVSPLMPVIDLETQTPIEIKFENVGVHYYSIPSWLGGRAFKALQNIDLNVEDKSLAIVGRSGAGKSTLIELLFGLKEPTVGRISLFGHSLPIRSSKVQAAVCRLIQLVPQEPHTSLNPYYTVRQILAEPLSNLDVSGNHESIIEESLSDVGLPATLLSLKSNQLSTGQAQRVAIARALVVRPAVLVADEPTSSLDPVNRQRLLDLLNSLKKKRDMRLILVTHDLGAAKALCEEVLVLDHGEMVEFGPTEQVMGTPAHPATQLLIESQPLSKSTC
ncbi:peptide ABC transporter [Vibrio lentus]|uniref:ABC transporter ATP-binding protein n=1 Tax=Vibrio lentus TaxID=136468 RepID=UPI000C8287C5|nr:ATP-binding cassette domain-containing protein [Vibrio lentus]MCC4816052.1 ATP-binding cassette domain-containing protein [Vibrio lentus]PMG67744.1 peptide ABC transporter [Vibrio lentus]PMK86589.1 peptide ABC transporter [Vibrio lentus]PML21033.1 peptide ABC transporter [Vibrio lentus]PMM23751.1 peptide ABC transporter [Vibrio lentus]